ncbi:cGMP-inhibited 3',5'-cyclic phosphodiesterase A [Platysternon megacephalum]|uniref:cGMP-inhibited 3',5'-cyclic phosphodiesterase A n=1 Tax=Platysternon megacephalum TaxID=55544 RepID=A0A4D9ELI9_9SAUR|nr:cGMP-inhibited 3',5'-cyclic phosphodiesterase A [Platysternon megacephalum]
MLILCPLLSKCREGVLLLQNNRLLRTADGNLFKQNRQVPKSYFEKTPPSKRSVGKIHLQNDRGFLVFEPKSKGHHTNHQISHQGNPFAKYKALQLTIMQSHLG